MCVAFYDNHMHKIVLCNSQLNVRGVANSGRKCKGMALHLILNSAHDNGILQDVLDMNVLSKRMLNPARCHNERSGWMGRPLKCGNAGLWRTAISLRMAGARWGGAPTCRAMVVTARAIAVSSGPMLGWSYGG